MPTHGSLTKAGKVRAQTPQIVGMQRKSPIPRTRNRNNFMKRVVYAPREQRFRRRR
jgi:small subunit ribosomal protein S30e